MHARLIVLAALVSLAFVPVAHAQQTASAAIVPPAPATNDITSIAIQSSSWRRMQLDVSYQLIGAPASPIIAARWLRKNGRRLAFTPVSEAIQPGARRVTFATTHKGVLPPPSKIILHLEMRSATGGPLVQYDCQLALVNPDGKEAWVADVARGRQVRWVNRRCTRK
ncbi:MAG: hypothetical protein M3081_12200 [Gemmatimonadota bacterium]|nr:hypothetical protein [Gemmatimonadota bacterium]